jgi:hypothetical protein
VSAAGSGARLAWRGTRQVWREGTRRDPTRLKRRMRPDPHWREPLDGAAPRLDPRSRIEVTRTGRFREIDPYRTVDGWRDGWKVVGFLGWAAAVGTAWWLGSSRGRGPLAILAEDHEQAF